jgi:probable phosphoglycerate mutase
MTENLFESPESRAPQAAAGWLTAHCDGGSRGNPGPSGYGAVIEDAQGRVVARLSEFLGRQTNNYAEYAGLIAVLKWANDNGAKRLRVVSDSELMVKQMKGQYKVKNPGLFPLWEEAKRRAAKLDRFEMRHTLRGGNREADRLANEAMDRGLGKPASQPAAADGTAGQSAAADESASRRPEKPAARPAAHRPAPPPPAKPTRQILEGYVKGGVVHLLDGELPDGIFVKIIRE